MIRANVGAVGIFVDWGPLLFLGSNVQTHHIHLMAFDVQEQNSTYDVAVRIIRNGPTSDMGFVDFLLFQRHMRRSKPHGHNQETMDWRWMAVPNGIKRILRYTNARSQGGSEYGGTSPNWALYGFTPGA